ncbi:ABC transporter permease [Nostocoides australiense]|uniref:Ribose ABC transporter, permease protein (RbsC-2) n=1 Tax=Nostocoides australiense Ben110 TaxID=1193182 RepID=W6JVL2_9MICO|nr:ABC transporter permease [Tetrasphaera australiensis]MCA0291767.1 ABC transporter permease [Actinomycetota bacterium]MCB1299977.1 ABC transporter permease [Tetrasphaera sp.]CCH72721.1 Ribose ABC transporter, permease protein (RbsC-2) [Tetrasphaera australiensis Ben110]HPF79723.1 ABC transporter permease [Tetrasphaera australiensis]HRW01883.1 ABC transporter permease [Tetrasphaera sp.]
MSDFITLTITAMVPFLFVAQGTMLSGRAGIFNVSQEGLMLLGAAIGYLVSLKWGGNLVGLLVAALAGAAFGAILGWATTYLRMDQFVVGLALFFLSGGTASLLYRVVIGADEPPRIRPLPDIVFGQDVLVFVAIGLSALLWWWLYRTDSGMRLRSVGENPKAADSLGINVTRTRMLAASLGGGLMAVGGAYLPMAFSGVYADGIVAGRGWLAIALAFFGGWRPQLILAGSLFFAAMDVLAQRAQVSGIGIPHQFVSMLPYVATLLVMIFAFRWALVPQFLGKNYDRESRITG